MDKYIIIRINEKENSWDCNISSNFSERMTKAIIEDWLEKEKKKEISNN